MEKLIQSFSKLWTFICKCQGNWTVILALRLRKFSSLGIQENINASTLWKLKLETDERIFCSEIWSDSKIMTFCFCCEQILLASAYYIEKKKTSHQGHGHSKSLPRSQEFMNNQYIWNPLKRSLKPPESISAFWPMIRKIKWVFTLLTFWFCKYLKFCATHGTIFQTLHTQHPEIPPVFPLKFTFEPAGMLV